MKVHPLLNRALKCAGELAARFVLNLFIMGMVLVVGFSWLLIAAHAGAASEKALQPATKSAGSASVKSKKAESLTANPAVAAGTLRYIEGMVRNNRIQGESLNSYEKAFLNNWNTLVRLERRVLENPQALCDPLVREVYEKAQAALDSAQVFSESVEDIEYSAGGRVLQLPDGTMLTVPQDPLRRKVRTSEDYSGAARMTDQVINDLARLLKVSK